ncbi:DivIVA domain-containing protein [Actinocorallia sp. A-T 12471]|uniref:DivIVA domain-containing protein n=1 Tax=Actinocorallia sp. A-T 12471 TaxID=3089813 RepID=UPI0029CBC9A2|nr:DivIVA domain-containing protein [Actinocorallia sp. A-T 12471]MDX6743064.1 DivIVA domain-containing protein [Actinocorallia sp. A-T 12471]
MPLTPADVRNKQFSTTRLRPGYDEEEVDAFLDEVEAELDRLIQENEELRAKLAECLRGKVPAMAAPIVEPKPDMAPPMPEPMLQQQPPMQQPQQPEPVMGLTQHAAEQINPRPSTEDNMDTAARVLALAQQTADQAIADARREADEHLGRARREAEDILGKARRQADQIVSEARSRAEQLDRDAQERHRQVMGSLVQQREELERRVDDLRAFEREYRSRLKAYLEGQLRELEAGADTFQPSLTGPQPVAVPAHAGATQSAPVVTGPTPFPPPSEPAQHGGTGAFHVGEPPQDRR